MKREQGEGNEEIGRVQDALYGPSFASCHQREVRGLVVMTAVVMAAGLGDKQQRFASSEAAVATTDKMGQLCCCHGKFHFRVFYILIIT